MSEKGIKESKELIVGVNELALFLVKRLKDGADLQDALAVWEKLTSDEDFKAVLQKAYEGAHEASSELKDLSVEEAIEIMNLQLNYVPKLMEAAA